MRHLFGLLIQLVSFFKAINASAGINKFLFSGEKRVALRTNFYFNAVFVCGACFECVATGAFYRYGLIIWMDAVFHFISLLSEALSNNAFQLIYYNKNFCFGKWFFKYLSLFS